MIDVKYWNYVVAVFVLVLLAVMFVICLPLFDGILLGIGLYYIMEPIVRRLSKYMKRSIAALLVEIAFCGICIAIFAYIAQQLISEVSNIDISSETITARLQNTSFSPLNNYINNNWDSLVGKISDILYNNLFDILSSVVDFLIVIMVAVFVSYYFLKDKSDIGEFILSLVPLEKKKQVDRLFNSINATLEGIFFGHVMAALIIGVVCVIVFNIFAIFVDFPYPTILAIVTGFFALIPIGPSVIAWPINFYLLYLDFKVGLVFSIFNVMLLIIPEYVLRPKLAGKSGNVHEMWILFVFLGGPLALGIGGFILGPLVLGVCKAAYDVYIEDYRKKEEYMIEMGVIEDIRLHQPATRKDPKKDELASEVNKELAAALGAFTMEEVLAKTPVDKSPDESVDETSYEPPLAPPVPISTELPAAVEMNVAGKNDYESSDAIATNGPSSSGNGERKSKSVKDDAKEGMKDGGKDRTKSGKAKKVN